MEKNKFDFDEDQNAAINHDHNSNAIVSAAAGSGKTTVLVARVIRLLSDASLGISADRLAIMTYTNNATASMREKLNKEMTKELNALADKPSDEARKKYVHLKQQMSALRRASISTITAFCLKMIKENAEEFDLPLNFRIADDAKKASLQAQAMNETWQEFYSNFTDNKRNALFFSFNFEDDNYLKNSVLSIAEKLSNFPDPDQWIADAKNVYMDIGSDGKNFLDVLDNTLQQYISCAEINVKKYDSSNIYGLLENDIDNTDKKEKDKAKVKSDYLDGKVSAYINCDKERVRALKSDFAAYQSNRSVSALDKLMKNLAANTEKLPYIHGSSGGKLEHKELFNKLKNDVKAPIDKLLEIKTDEAEEIAALPALHTAISTFLELVTKYIENYKKAKIAAGCIDFSDCERELYNKLSENGGDNDFRRQLSQRFDCIIVDEFQDSNKIQAEIFRLLGDGHLFYVGDAKQSIYAFRGADPYIMANMCDDPNSGFKRLPLNFNYRSRSGVINTVNFAFSGLMTPEFGGVDYSGQHRLKKGSDLPDPDKKELYDSEIFFVTKAAKDDDNDHDMTLPSFVAKKIKELCGNENFLVADGKDKETDEYKYRRAKYSDVIVLLRSNTKINDYRKALAELKIPSIAPKGSKFFDADEVLLTYNYLKVIDNPLLNEEMLKVLMSPIYRFTADETAQLRMGILGLDTAKLSEEQLRGIADTYKGKSLYNAVLDCMTQKAECGDDTIEAERRISPKLERFYSDFKAFRYHMSSNSLDSLVRKIYEDTDLIAVVAAFEDSAGRVENVRKLQRLAADFKANRGGGLGDFLRYFDRAKENARNRAEEAARPEDSSDAVRIMTFHGSKGLEAPICIMSELQSKLIDDDYTSNMIVHPDRFIAMKHTDIKKRCKTKTFSYNALSKFIRDRQLGDELRLLYVAMTRAQEKLIMVSTLTDKQYDEFHDYVKDNAADPDKPYSVYEGATPFKCVLSTLLQYAPTIDAATKTFMLDNDIGCRITAVDSGSEVKVDPKRTDTASDVTIEVSEDEVKKISELMKKEYAHIVDTEQRAKFTTTELAHPKSAPPKPEHESSEKAPFKPVPLTNPTFAKKRRVSGVEKGNAYHHCMQHFPLERLNAEMSFEETLDVVKKAIDDMTGERKLTDDERRIIESGRVAKFFTGELGRRVLRAYSQDAENVKREQSFYAEVNVDELRGHYKGNELHRDYKGSISIQGQIDLYFIEDGKFVVVDYKSDTTENLAEEKENYEFQVEIYTKILKKLTGTDVKEMYLYAFLADKEMKV